MKPLHAIINNPETYGFSDSMRFVYIFLSVPNETTDRMYSRKKVMRRYSVLCVFVQTVKQDERVGEIVMTMKREEEKKKS